MVQSHANPIFFPKSYPFKYSSLLCCFTLPFGYKDSYSKCFSLLSSWYRETAESKSVKYRDRTNSSPHSNPAVATKPGFTDLTFFFIFSTTKEGSHPSDV